MTTHNSNPKYEQTVCPHCGQEVYVRYQDYPVSKILGLVDSNGVITNTKSNPDIESIYDYWNSQHIIVHRKMTTDITKSIKAALKDYTEEELIQAIKNYAEIQQGKQYWFNYTWTLKDFLKRGVAKFIDLEVAKSNYLNREISPKDKPQHKWCRQCNYKAETTDTICPQCGEHLEKDYFAGQYAHLIKH